MTNTSFQLKSENKIASVHNLLKALDLTPQEIDQADMLPSDERYTEKHVAKSDGTERIVYKPHFLIRKIQRRIKNRIFKTIVKWPDYLYGSIPNEQIDEDTIISKEYVNCAAQHCNAKSILKIDIKDFFNNINKFHVHAIFNEFFKFDEDSSSLLTNMCCHNDFVIQGALTSSFIANLCLWNLEPDLVKKLHRTNLVYTRLVDDITVSSKLSNYQFDNAIALIKNMLIEKDLPINNNKTKILNISSEPLMVHGLRVNFSTPRYPSDEVRKLRAAVHNIEKLASETGYRTSIGYRKDFNRCLGRVNKLKRVQHSQHENLINKLKKIWPLPSKQDVKRASTAIQRLERDFSTKGDTYWYKQRFFHLHERLNIIQRTYIKFAKQTRDKLKKIKPKYNE
jgi:RNA-directed DNA polymerase